MGPFCQAPTVDHIVKLVWRLAVSLMGANVPEVKVNLKEQDPIDFDATLFVSNVTAAYPEQFKSCLEDWSSHSQERDLVGEVIPLITHVKSAHYNNGCNVDCSNCARDELTCIAMDA